jgi:dipeptidase E
MSDKRGAPATAVVRRRIVAIGGGGFTAAAGDAALERYIVELTGRASPRVCLLPTASGDPDEQIRRFGTAFRRFGAAVSHVALFRLGEEPVALEEHLLSQDVIYVGGGSLLNLIAIWRAHGVERILREAWERGILLSGVSAGSMCWFAAGITKSQGPPRPGRALGFLAGSNCVHYEAQPERRRRYLAAVQAGELDPGYGVDDGAALLLEGDHLIEAVSARQNACAYRVDVRNGVAVERALPTRLLASDDSEDLAITEMRDHDRHARSAGLR